MRSPGRPPPVRPSTILCVDDEGGSLLVRKAVLESAGYGVLTAMNASEGLRIFKSSEVDAVISDHLLPDVPGTEMARDMKLAKPDVPILLLSGVTDLPAGAEHTDKFVTKTDGPEKLLHAVAELLRYRRVHVSEGAYCAEVACDTLASSAVWHCLPAAFPAQTSVLNSWKEIAGYLGRGVRTVQRWEHDSALPVHRPKGKDRSAVLALREELDDWLRRTSVRSNGNGNGDAGHATSDIAPVLLTHGNRLANMDRQNWPEMKKLVSAVDEIVRELTVVVSGAPAGSSGSKPDNQPHLVVRKSG